MLAFSLALLFCVACSTVSTQSTSAPQQKSTIPDWFRVVELTAAPSLEAPQVSVTETEKSITYAEQIAALQGIMEKVQGIASTVETIIPIVTTTYQAHTLWQAAQTISPERLPLCIYEATSALEATDAEATMFDVIAVNDGQKALVKSDLYKTWETALQESSSEAEFIAKICASSLSTSDLLSILKTSLSEVSKESQEFTTLTSDPDFKSMLVDLTQSSFGFSQASKDARTTLDEVSSLTTTIPETLGSLSDSIPNLMTLLGHL
jgi:hypothetical protein